MMKIINLKMFEWENDEDLDEKNNNFENSDCDSDQGNN